MTRRGKPDSTKKLLVTAILGLGASWEDTGAGGTRGRPDGVIGYRGVDQWAELKAPGAAVELGPGRTARTVENATIAAQEAFRADWRGRPVAILRTVEEVKAVVDRMGFDAWKLRGD